MTSPHLAITGSLGPTVGDGTLLVLGTGADGRALAAGVAFALASGPGVEPAEGGTVVSQAQTATLSAIVRMRRIQVKVAS